MLAIDGILCSKKMQATNIIKSPIFLFNFIFKNSEEIMPANKINVSSK